MKQFLISALMIVVLVTVCDAQTFQWAHSLGLSNRSRAMAIANDSLGNVYTLGVEKTYTQSIMGEYATGDLLLEKRDTKGNLQWAKHFPGHACGLDIAVGSNNFILITGAFYDSLYFGAGDTLQSPGLVDRMFLASFTQDGTLNWAIADTSQWGAIGTSITSAGGLFLISGITEDVQGMLRVYDINGEFVWQKTFPGVRNIDNLVFDANSNLYISGTCTAQASFDGIVVPPDTALAQYISFVAKLSPLGSTEWLHTNTYSTFDISTTLAFDNLGYLCRVRNSKDFQYTIFEVIEPTVDSVLASWQFPMSSGVFDRLITNSLTSTGSGQYLFGPYYANTRFDTTVIYQLRHGISGLGTIFFIDTVVTIRGRGLRVEALSLKDRTLYFSGSFTDSVLHMGQVALANTNDFVKFHSDQFIACLALDDAAGVPRQQRQNPPLVLFPNPASDDVTLAFDDARARVVSIYNVEGALIKHVTSHSASETISMQGLPSGVYTAIVRDIDGKTSTKSFVHTY